MNGKRECALLHWSHGRQPSRAVSNATFTCTQVRAEAFLNASLVGRPWLPRQPKSISQHADTYFCNRVRSLTVMTCRQVMLSNMHVDGRLLMRLASSAHLSHESTTRLHVQSRIERSFLVMSFCTVPTAAYLPVRGCETGGPETSVFEPEPSHRRSRRGANLENMTVVAGLNCGRTSIARRKPLDDLE